MFGGSDIVHKAGYKDRANWRAEMKEQMKEYESA